MIWNATKGFKLSMHCPTVNELPPPPPGRTGWPWTEANDQLPDTTPDGSTWPRVSIVTPSYNQGEFIEETIRSVLLQGYPNLEYIIVDGGSSDESVEVIHKYEPWLAYWISEPDEGQVYAIDKGWAHATGAVLAYLNSDDTYLPGAIENAVQALAQVPGAVAVCGGELRIDRLGRVLSERIVQSASLMDLLNLRFVPQPAVFVWRTAVEEVGGLDLSFQTAFDFELWTRLSQHHGGIHCIPSVLATTRWYPETKTLSQRPTVIAELERIIEEVLSGPQGQMMSSKERSVIRSRLSYTAAAALADGTKEHRRAALSAGWTSFVNQPRIAPDLLRLTLRKTLPPSIVQRLRGLKFLVRNTQSQRGWKPGQTHWSQWMSEPHSPPEELE